MLATPCAHIVVDVRPGHRPALPLRQPLTISDLPRDSQTVRLPVGRDPGIDPRTHSTNNHSGNIQEHSHGPASLRLTGRHLGAPPGVAELRGCLRATNWGATARRPASAV